MHIKLENNIEMYVKLDIKKQINYEVYDLKNYFFKSMLKHLRVFK